MNERPAARTRLRSRRALVLGLTLAAAVTVVALAATVGRAAPESDGDRVHPEVEAQMRMVLSKRHIGELFPFAH